MQTQGELNNENSIYFSLFDRKFLETEAKGGKYKGQKIEQLYTVGDDDDSDESVTHQSNKYGERLKTQMRLDDSEQHSSIQQYDQLVKDLVSPQLSQIRFRASSSSIQLSNNESLVEMKTTQRRSSLQQDCAFIELGQPICEQGMKKQNDTVSGIAKNIAMDITEKLNTAFVNECNCSDDEEESSLQMINTARQNFLTSSLIKKTFKPVLSPKKSYVVQPQRKVSNTNQPKTSSEEAVPLGSSILSSSVQLPELKLSLFDYNRESREEAKEPKVKKSKDLIRQYENLPQEISDIIIQQNMKIDNLRYQVLELQGQKKFIMQQMSIMQENYTNNTNQLNQQIQVIMEALNLLLSQAGNDEESLVDLSNKQGCQGAKKHAERPIQNTASREVQQEINSARQQIQQVIAFNKQQKQNSQPDLTLNQDAMQISKKPVYRT